MRATLFLFVILVAAIMVPIIIAVYVYRDAHRRSMNAVLWALVAALVPTFIGLLVYLLVRGNYSDLNCPQCGTRVQEQFVVCPSCGAKLRASCPNCATPVEPGWKVCPNCAQPLPESYHDVQPPVRPQDRSLAKVLAIVIIIPVLLIGLLVFGFTIPSVGGAYSSAYREASTREYLEEMRTEISTDTADKVEKWLNDIDYTQNTAYVLEYTEQTDSGTDYYYLVMIPSIGGSQPQSGLVHHDGIFGTTLTLTLTSTSGERTLFNVMTSSENAIKLKVTLNGEKIPCKVTTVNYNPTLFSIE